MQRDNEKAEKLLLRAISLGNVKSRENYGILLNNMGVAYADGKGVEKDYKKAEQLYLKAIEFGNQKARENYEILSQNIIAENRGFDSTEEKTKGCGTTLMMWVCIICAIGGFLLFVANELVFIGTICLIIFSIIGLLVYNSGPTSLKREVNEIWRQEEDRRLNGGFICPNCGRNAGHPIGVIGKSVSVGAFGLASNKIGKTYKCENCGYMW